MMRMMLVLMVFLAGCGPTTQTKTLTGHAHFGWEWSFMKPDGSADSYWIQGDNAAMEDLFKRVNAVAPKKKEPDDQHVYVTLRGEVTGPGKYGHLGGSPYLLHVTQVVEVRLPKADDPPEVMKKR